MRFGKAQDIIKDAKLIVDEFDKCIENLDYSDMFKISCEMNKFLRENPTNSP
jgi:hypothetical protein